MSQDQFGNTPDQSFNQPAESDQLTGHPRPAAGGGQVVGEGAEDATPSNTASNNCNIPFFKPLRWGVDSLYMSYPGELGLDTEVRLEELKRLAQSSNPIDQLQAQYLVDGHLFEVKDKGAGIYPYILDDNAFRIQLSRASKTKPMSYCQISSQYLSHVGPVVAEKSLFDLMQQLGTVHEYGNVSRIDLFVDFTSNVDMESWARQAWVTRAASISSYSVDGKFSGWAIGQGLVISARLYDKRLEIAVSNKGYLRELWKAAGWQEDQPVWRLEFQIKRQVLTQKGLSKLDSVLRHLNGLWDYATTEWLRLTLPQEHDKTRSRWPIHPLWAALASIDWETNGGPLTRKFTAARIPGDERLFNLAFSAMVSFMAREGITDFYSGQEAFMSALCGFHEHRAHVFGQSFDAYVAERVGLKARVFNTIMNAPDREQKQKEAELKKAIQKYRKASDGE